jgi:hypothetical protein
MDELGVDATAPISEVPVSGADAVRLETQLVPASGRQRDRMDDALRLLATWAVRAARKGRPETLEASESAANALTSPAEEVMNHPASSGPEAAESGPEPAD